MTSHRLDIRGEICPYTLIHTRRRMAALSRGDRLEVLIDNAEATETIPHWARSAGHKLIELKEEAGCWKLILEKGEA